MSHPKIRAALLGALTLMAPASAAWADDQPFITLYTTDVDTQGERELGQWLLWSAGHAHQTYDDVLSQSEFEYGITDDLQGSLYLNYEWSRDRDPAAPAGSQSLVGIHGELIYRVLNVYFDPFVLSFYLDPSYAPDHRAVEARILLQKNFFNDTLRLVVNTNFEDDWDRYGTRFARTGALEFRAGAAYNITPDFSAGFEFSNEHAFNGLILGTAASEQTSDYYIGPTLQYVGTPATVTLSFQAQLPVAANVSGAPGLVSNGFAAQAERYRVGLRISTDF